MNFYLLSKYGPKFWTILEVDQSVIPADPELDSIIFQQRKSVEQIMVLGNIFEDLLYLHEGDSKTNAVGLKIIQKTF